MGISVALFGSVFVAMAMVLTVIVAPPYGWIMAAIVMVATAVILTTGVRNELSKIKEQELM